jgi:hypothetical protein
MRRSGRRRQRRSRFAAVLVLTFAIAVTGAACRSSPRRAATPAPNAPDLPVALTIVAAVHEIIDAHTFALDDADGPILVFSASPLNLSTGRYSVSGQLVTCTSAAFVVSTSVRAQEIARYLRPRRCLVAVTVAAAR